MVPDRSVRWVFAAAIRLRERRRVGGNPGGMRILAVGLMLLVGNQDDETHPSIREIHPSIR
jgi:hypothetical protein